MPRPQPGPAKEADDLRHIPLLPGFKPPEQPDPVLQGAGTAAHTSLAPTVLKNFDGIGQGVPSSFNVQFAPPDTNGAVGVTQYVQWVNSSFAIFDKATGNMLPNFPVPGNTLWTGFGGPCETSNDGDPVVVYDKLADRWVLSQLVVTQGFFQCVAVSTTSDATGTYNRYSFPYSNFDDYPKMGVWPDAYYETFNMFGSGFLGANACAYDRNAMLNGQAATQICFQQVPSVSSLLPADVDGHTPPPVGSPNFMVDFDVNSLNLYKFHVDFANPNNSTFSTATNIPVAPFTPLCNGQSFCVPQSGTTTQLDSLADRLMYRLAYRNFGDHESLVVNHAVAVGPTASSGSGVRWYELQNPNGTVTVTQQSTFAPDITQFRWMGSIAMDRAGDIALGYSVSSGSMFPSIAIAAREAADPPSTLQPEISIISGAGSQTGLDRWGDYSAMQVDPVDDCTFWYTTEYLKVSGSFNWNTRIASFKFTNCDKPDMTITSTHTGNFTQGQTGKTYTLTAKNVGGKATDGVTAVTVTDTLPSGLTATAISSTDSAWVCTLATLSCTRTDVLAAGASYPDITVTANVSNTAPGQITNTATVAGGGEVNLNNDTASDVTTIIQLGPDPAVTKTHTGPFIQGQTGTYTITVSNVGLSPLDGTTVTVTDTLPTGLTGITASGTGWTCNTPTTCTRTDALASNTSYPAITLNVNVANNAPLGVAVNTVTVSGGGDVNTLNDTATDPTTIIPPPPDLTITKSHTGNFAQGFGALYILSVNNIGAGSTKGTVTVTDTLPTGLTVIAASGTGWTCIVSTNLATMTCTRSDSLAGNTSYPVINLNVNVAGNAPASVTNTATVSGGGEINTSNDTASDPTTIDPAPSFAVTKSHTGNFTVGQTGTYTITVSNIGSLATNGSLVTVNDGLPSGMTATAVSGTGWTCSSVPTTFVSCTRSDVLAANSPYPSITLTVAVDGSVAAQVTNLVVATGGGDANGRIGLDPTTINVPDLAITKTHNGNFTVGQTGAVYTITVSNVGTIATAGGIVTVQDFMPFGLTATAASGTGWICSIGSGFFVNCTQPAGVLAPGGSYPPITLTVNVTAFNPFPITNTATVSGIGDANPNNNSASDRTTVLPAVGISPTSPTSATVTGGIAATYTFTVSLATNPPVGTVTFNATSIGIFPPNAKVTFNPPSLTASGSVTMTVDTSGNGHVASLAPPGFSKASTLYAALFFPLFGLFVLKLNKRKGGKSWLGAAMGVCGLALLLAFSGCGGGGTPPPPPPVVTPPGTYSITMTATSSNGTVQPAVMPITLIVK